MILEIIISFITLVCIIAFVVWLAMQPQKRILEIAVPTFIVSFAIIYAFYLLAYLVPDEPIFGIPAAFSAFVETFGSFTNGVAYSDVAESDEVTKVFGAFWFETLFWALHMFVIISIAISGFAVFGRKLMDKVRYNLHLCFSKGDHAKDIYFIFGDSEGALVFGKNLVERGRSGKLVSLGSESHYRNRKPFVVYFSNEYTEDLRERIADFGGALIEVNEDTREVQLKKAERINPQNVIKFEGLVRPTVNGYDIAELLARKVVKANPPYKSMFPEDGDQQTSPSLRIPERPYAAIVIGFGELGRECLRQLIMSSQLTLNGTKPKFRVISRNGVSFDRFCLENPSIGMCADIEFIEADIFSFEAANAINEAVNDDSAPLRQVYVCCAPVQTTTPEEGEIFREKNREIIRYLSELLKQIGPDSQEWLEKIDRMFVTPCVKEADIWTPEIILHRELDRRAIALNGSYCGNDVSKEEANLSIWNGERDSVTDEWISEPTSELDKDSSRASADFMEAFYALLGIDPSNTNAKSAYDAMLKNTGVLNALAQIEHSRWMAFYCSHGFSPMDITTFRKRANDHTSFTNGDKPHSDTRRKTHPCLVSWEELPELDPIYAIYKTNEKPLQKKDEESPRNANKFVGI